MLSRGMVMSPRGLTTKLLLFNGMSTSVFSAVSLLLLASTGSANGISPFTRGGSEIRLSVEPISRSSQLREEAGVGLRRECAGDE